MTDYTASGGGTIQTSDKVNPGDTVEMLDLPQGLSHSFIGIQMFDAGGALVVATAGTVLIDVKTHNTLQYEAIDDGPTITAATPTTSSVGTPLSALRVTPTGLTGITTWRVVLVQFVS